jgi:hypothetical protein
MLVEQRAQRRVELIGRHDRGAIGVHRRDAFGRVTFESEQLCPIEHAR